MSKDVERSCSVCTLSLIKEESKGICEFCPDKGEIDVWYWNLGHKILLCHDCATHPERIQV